MFVHGVPETPAIWEPLIAELGPDDVISLQLPGFGCPLPDEFEPTMHSYASWMAAHLDALGGGVDLVAHDWGALLAVKVLGDRPERVRSFVTDGADLTSDFKWHDMATLWQTPGEGEAFMESFVGGSAEERAALLVGSGVPDHAASAMAESIDDTMAGAILTLYRSAVDIGVEWGPSIDHIDVPAMVVDAAQDGFRREGLAARLAERLGARHEILADQGHWWMLGDPAGAAAAISSFWSDLP